MLHGRIWKEKNRGKLVGASRESHERVGVHIPQMTTSRAPALALSLSCPMMSGAETMTANKMQDDDIDLTEVAEEEAEDEGDLEGGEGAGKG